MATAGTAEKGRFKQALEQQLPQKGPAEDRVEQAVRRMTVEDRFRAMLRTWLTKEELDRVDSFVKVAAGANVSAAQIYNATTTHTESELELLGEQAKEPAVAMHSGASAEGDKQKLEGEGYEHLKARNLYGESEAGTYSKYVERRELEMQVTNPHTLSKVNLYIDFNKNNLTLMEDRNIIAERLPLELFDDFIDESIDIKSRMDDRKDRGEPPF